MSVDFLKLKQQRILYFKRSKIRNSIVEAAENKEIDVQFQNIKSKLIDGNVTDEIFSYHLKQRTVLKFPQEVLDLALKGASSFHASEELWSNPLSVKTGMNKKELDELRIGWDLVVDIDCHMLEYSKIAAHIIIEFFKSYNIKSISCKYSGNKGFHVGIPYEAFPQKINGEDTAKLFPEAPRKIILFMIHKISSILGDKILEYENGNFQNIIEKTKIPYDQLVIRRYNPKIYQDEDAVNGAKIADIDVGLISSRHLYRMPYSFNEKSGLLSIPIHIDSVLKFDKNIAKPEFVKIDDNNDDIKFLNRDYVDYGEASQLLKDAYDFCATININEKIKEDNISKAKIFDNSKKDYEPPKEPVDEKCFPPCILNALNGMEDGKKRMLFALLNFLSSLGWDKEKSTELLKKWNEKNPDPITETIMNGQIRYSYLKKDPILPPNCKDYYMDLGLCKPDKLCERVKNPCNYALKKDFLYKRRSEMIQEEEEKKAKQKAKQEKKKNIEKKNNSSDDSNK
jgi:hypothetical protein